MKNLEEYIDRTIRKQQIINDVKYHVGFSFGIFFFILLTGIFMGIFFWLYQVKLPSEIPVSHIVELREFKQAFDSTPQKSIFDMRAKTLFSEGHLPGAQQVNRDHCMVYGINTCSLKSTCDQAETAFFYSIKGEEYHEVRRALNEDFSGCWKDVYLLDGGFRAWENAEYDIE